MLAGGGAGQGLGRLTPHGVLGAVAVLKGCSGVVWLVCGFPGVRAERVCPLWGCFAEGRLH